MTRETVIDDLVGVIDEADLARRLGLAEADVVKALAGEPLPPMAYRRLKDPERAGFYQGLVDRLTVMQLTDGVQSNPENWSGAWDQVLERVRDQGVSLDSLRPDYYDFDSLRLDQDYAFTEDPAFEHHFYLAVLRCLFATYLPDVRRTIDLGCGAGSSLYILADMFPDMALCGCDWATPSQEIVREIGRAMRRPMEPVNLDLNTMNGWDQVALDEETAVITLHSMEQLGENFDPLLLALLAARPKIIIHLEQLLELYDPDNIADKIALTYHRQREYLEGYLPRLRSLRKAGDIEILDERRLHFGSLWHEAYGLIVWRPV